MTQPQKDCTLISGLQHTPLAKGEPHFHQKLILEITTPPQKKNGAGEREDFYNMDGPILLEVKRPKQSIPGSAYWERRKLVKGPRRKRGSTESRSQVQKHRKQDSGP